MLITPRGEPVPPQSAVRRLAAVDARLTMEWVSSAAGPYWGIMERWRSDDPRWRTVRSGEISEAYARDLLAMLPSDCSAEDVEGFILRTFGRVRDPKEEAMRQIERVAKANTGVRRKVKEKFLEEQEHKTRTTTKHELEVSVGAATAHPMVPGARERLTTP